MKVVIIFLILCCSLSSLGEDNPSTPIASSLINCTSDLYDKDGDCELVLSYNSKDLSVSLIKLHNRGSSEGANINDFVQFPTDFKNDVNPVNYREKLSLKENESVMSVGGGFIRNAINKNQLEIKLRVQVGVKETMETSDVENSPEEEGREIASEESEVTIFKNKRQVQVQLEI